ncbi:hypothetical protein ILUMI_02633 [Ignelater luminosus]|uniref:Transmembrane protein n=1 Tax=Ignelater luminosus TaxID=2038154 RepID=A0A8K0DC92_IGNLU|nr:hypothetical protein ILUMI_02633 [Ignelater luminosus]
MKKYVLIIFLVNLILVESADSWGVNSQLPLIMDMSTTCIDDLHTDVYLPFGMGVADSCIILVSDNDYYPNCMVTFCTVGGKAGVYLIIVVEFPDHTLGAKNACQDDGSTILIKEPAYGEIDVCNEVNKLKLGYFQTATYSLLSNASNASVIITSKSLFETVKVTVTSARKLNQYERCDSAKEIPCVIANASVCISKELLCDENINCGTSALNDEDVRICDESRYNRLWLVVVSGTLMVMIIVFFLIHLLRTCLPAVPDSFFIFNEDEDNKLILSTKFVAPSQSLRQVAVPQKLPADTSSFRFKSIPVSSISEENLSFPRIISRRDQITPSTEELHGNASYNSNLPEMELQSLTYKEEIKLEVEDLIKKLPLKGETVEEPKPPKRVVSKRPRFEETEFVSIMDRIEPHTRSSKDHKEGRKKRKSDTRERTGSHKAGAKKGSIEIAHMQREKKEHFTSFTGGHSSKRRSNHD